MSKRERKEFLSSQSFAARLLSASIQTNSHCGCFCCCGCGCSRNCCSGSLRSGMNLYAVNIWLPRKNVQF